MKTFTRKGSIGFLLILFMLFGGLFLGKQLYYNLSTQNSIPYLNPILDKPVSENQKNLSLLLEAEIELNRDNPENALINYIEVAKNTQDPKIAERATKLALSYGTEVQAIEPATIWATRDPENTEANLTIAGLLLLKQEGNNAIPYLRTLITQDKMNLDKSLLSLYRQLNDESVQKLFQKLLTDLAQDPTYQNKPEAAALHLSLAEIYLMENQPELAYLHSSQLAKANHIPLPPRAHIIHAQVLFLKGQNQTAIGYLENQIKQTPSAALLRIYLLDLFIETHQTEKAKLELNKMAKLTNLTPSETLQIAKITLEAEWLKEAKSFFLLIKDDEKEGDNAKYFIARIEDMENHPTIAIGWYKQVVNSPYYLNAQLRAAVLLSKQNETQQALLLLDELEPQTVEDYKKIILTQSQLLLKTNRYQEGYELLSKALIDLPEDEEILYARGIQAIQIKNYAQAESDFKEILKFEPNHPETLNALGYLLVEHLKKPDDAYPYLSKAIQIEPNNPSIMDSLGWFYYKKGNKIEALKWLKQAFTLSNDADIAAHLSEVLYSMGQEESAKKVVFDALQRFPNEPSLLKTQEKFKAITQPANARQISN
jgi:tetratricopeptide (TPR) repeat protein